MRCDIRGVQPTCMTIIGSCGKYETRMEVAKMPFSCLAQYRTHTLMFDSASKDSFVRHWGQIHDLQCGDKIPSEPTNLQVHLRAFLLWLKFSRAATTVLAARKICADGYAKPCWTYELVVGTAGAVRGCITLRLRYSLSDSAPHPVLLLQAGRGDIAIVVRGLLLICGSNPLEL